MKIKEEPGKKRNVTKDIEKMIIEEILKNCDLNLIEKVVIKLFNKTFVEFCNIERIVLMNYWLTELPEIFPKQRLNKM